MPSEQVRQDDTNCGRAGGSQNEWIGQGISQDALKRRSRGCQPAANKQSKQDARQTNIEEMFLSGNPTGPRNSATSDTVTVAAESKIRLLIGEGCAVETFVIGQ